MIIVGAKGFAKELLEVCVQLGRTDNLAFFDNVSKDVPKYLFGEFPILRTEEEVKTHFRQFGNEFGLGVGSPKIREKLSHLFESWGGDLTSLISPRANIGSYDVQIGPGATILANTTISNSVQIGKAVLMYPNSIVTHDCVVGDYVELSPGATVLGNCTIDSHSHIGANATVLPNTKIGENCLVGAGSVVTKNILSNTTGKGVPFQKNS